MQRRDNNAENTAGWSWRPTARTWVLIAGLIVSLLPFVLRACGFKPTRTELPPVNTGFNSNVEAQKASNTAKQLANLLNQANAIRQNSEKIVINNVELRDVRGRRLAASISFPYPDSITVYGELQNLGGVADEFSTYSTIEWLIAPKEKFADASADSEVAWTDEVPLNGPATYTLARGEIRTVKIARLNLKKTLKEYTSERDKLWPGKLRLYVYTKAKSGEIYSKADAVEAILPR